MFSKQNHNFTIYRQIMSMNYALGFSLFLLVLVGLNVYFFYTLNTVGKRNSNFNVPGLPAVRFDLGPSVFKDIFDHLNYLPTHYRVKNPRFATFRKNLVQAFNFSQVTSNNVWSETRNWVSDESLFPYENQTSGRVLQAIRTSQIALVDNAPKGTQLKLLLLLEGKQKLYFKPKRYELDNVIKGNIYAGFDRHNSEVFGYYLGMVMNFKWIAPSTIRRIHVEKDIYPVATMGLKKTIVRNESGSLCIYGSCFYCKKNETVCADSRGEIEGAAILYLDKPMKTYTSPWRRSYSSKKMVWEKDNDFCKKVVGTLSMKRLLNLIDISLFDFLIQNGDRHRYEVYKDKIVLLDNGKGLGNSDADELDILAPLYQCCLLSLSTWRHLELLSGGSLADTIKMLASFQGEVLATEAHYKAVERRLLKIYATVQYCIGKHGSAKVFKDAF